MQLSESEVRQICLTPLFIFYAVATADRAPKKISQLHIIKAVEHGLRSKEAFCEELFDFFRSNLHHFFNEFSSRFDTGDTEALLDEVRATGGLLARMASGEGFRRAFGSFAGYLAEGSFGGRRPEEIAAMQERAKMIENILAGNS